METFKLFLTQFTDETIAISALSLIFVFSVLVAYWIYNRRKFQQLAHQIPATVVKNYLDSIIQNSTALKSSLFRGGGLEDGIPSVVPIAKLSTGHVGDGGLSSDVLNQKNAEIAALKNQLGDKDKLIADLEKKASQSSPDGGADVSGLNAEIERLEGLLKERDEELASTKLAGGESVGGNDDELQKQLEAITKERDELKDRLQEYEIIEEDLANLKRLQQENEQLKKTVASLKPGGIVETASKSEAAVSKKDEVAEAASEESTQDAPETVSENEVEAGPAASEDASAGSGDDQAEQKSAEELLNEFEKMLG